MRVLTLFALLTFLSVASAAAQPTLDTLWPNEDGRSFDYEGLEQVLDVPPASFTGRLIFDGTGTMAPGVTVQNRIGQINGFPAKMLELAPAGLSPLFTRLWIARPELRAQIVARASKRAGSMWPALLLAPADIPSGVGHRETATRIGSWRDEIADWSWWMLTDELTPGASFVLQLIPDLANDVFLNGTVRGIAEPISTGAGSWNDAVVMDYVVDQGEGTLTDESGNVVGTVVSEVRGWVAFVPGVGPVASSEDFNLLEVDCPEGCWQEAYEGESVSHVELSLRSIPVKTESQSWGAVKAQYED